MKSYLNTRNPPPIMTRTIKLNIKHISNRHMLSPLIKNNIPNTNKRPTTND